MTFNALAFSILYGSSFVICLISSIILLISARSVDSSYYRNRATEAAKAAFWIGCVPIVNIIAGAFLLCNFVVSFLNAIADVIANNETFTGSFKNSFGGPFK